jgi:hypothetical protein
MTTTANMNLANALETQRRLRELADRERRVRRRSRRSPT